jgi:hypothetical protein
VEARSSSGGAVVAQEEKLIMYDDWRQIGGGEIEVLELVARVG